MLTSEDTTGVLKITSDVPDDTELPTCGYFGEIVVSNWHGIRYTDSKVMVDATIPAMVELEMADGSRLTIWPDGTFVVAPRGAQNHETWSMKVTPEGVRSNPFRS